VEFFSINDDVWFISGGSVDKLNASDTETVSTLLGKISLFYPKAYEALQKNYYASVYNRPYFNFLIVRKFLRCNFGAVDDIPDIDVNEVAHFEYVNCPCKGECKLQNVVCNPEYHNLLSRAEMQVCKLWYDGLSIEDISEELSLSKHTIHNHISNAYARLKVHSKSEFVRLANARNIFTRLQKSKNA
jgi:DNA-binding CsgD family transcriptional regulator